VNTGRLHRRPRRNLGDTIYKNNSDAVPEIVHQLRFRNLGGLIIVDLIDMESAGNREKVYRALSEALRENKAKVNILKISELGLVEMTRKRTRESLEQQLCVPCSTCEGKGYLQSSATISNRIFRDRRRPRLTCTAPRCAPGAPGRDRDPARRGRRGLAGTGARIGPRIVVEGMPAYHPEQYQILPRARASSLWLRRTPPSSCSSTRRPVVGSLALDDEAEGEARRTSSTATRGGAGGQAPLDELADDAKPETEKRTRPTFATPEPLAQRQRTVSMRRLTQPRT
jgi:hypothetical protein